MDPRYSNYPRANVAQLGQRPPGAHFDFISQAFTIIRADLGTWILTSLVTILLLCALAFPLLALSNIVQVGNPLGIPASGGAASYNAFAAGRIAASVGLGIVTNTIVYALYAMLTIGIGFMGVRAARGERVTVADVFAPFRRFVPVFLTCLVVAFAVIAGAYLFIVPGVVALGFLSMAGFAAYDQDLSPGDALRWSIDRSRAHLWGIAGLAIVASFVSGLGACACYVGYLFTSPIFGIVLGLTYATFTAPAPAPFMPYPPTGPGSPPPSGGGYGATYGEPTPPPSTTPPPTEPPPQ